MKSISIIFLFAVTLVACKKEDQPTLTEDLAKNDWQKTSILMSVDSIVDTVPTIDLFATLPTCKKDNVWHFDATNNTFTLDEGATKCDVADPQTKDQGTITEQNNGSQLRVAGTSTNEIWEIGSRTASVFNVSYFARNPSNKLVKFRVTFSKI